MENDTSVKFGLEFDLSGIKKGMQDVASEVKEKFTYGIKKQASEAEDTINSIAKNTEKSLKARAASIAAIYKKQGMESSEAFKKAWEQIERQSGKSSQKVKKHIKGIGDQSKKESASMSGSFKGAFKKIAFSMAAAFSARAVINFGKECLELGSDLQEVQNVVDVTFPSMNAQVNEFAQNAAASFGLSETMAKKFTGTFGAMAKAFGFTESQAYDMGTTLTGLAGDVASFYNITQDEAYTKLKSVFTGETESLKELGIVMTQTALDSYAMANGVGKTTAKMTEAEKVALRYQFVQEQLSAATGDFIRTSDGWANQTRVLKLQFDSLKASIGQGLINVLTPVIKLMNTLLSKINQVASGFASLTEKLMGGKKESGVSSAVGETQALTDSLENCGNAAESTGKKIKNALFGFDELNVIQKEESQSGTSGAAGASITGQAGTAGKEETEQESALDRMIKKTSQLADIFKKGFKSGLGADFEKSLKRQNGHVKGIHESLKGIFKDPEVADAASTWAEKTILSMGQVIGAAASIGSSISENILGGIDGYLSENERFIRDRIVGALDASGQIHALAGNFSQAFADVMEAFRTDAAKSCTQSVISIVTNLGLTAAELAAKLGRDILTLFLQPFIDNKDGLKSVLEDMLEEASKVLDTAEETFRDFCEKTVEVYDGNMQPMFSDITSGISDLVSLFVDTYNTYLEPIIGYLGEKISGLMSMHVSPCFEKAMDMIGSLADAVGAIWKGYFQPLFDYLIGTILPILAPIIQTIGGIVVDIAGAIRDAIGSIFDMASGLLDFIAGAFTGDWKKAWGGILKISQGASDFFKSGINGMIAAVETLANGVVAAVNTIIRALNRLSFTTPDWLPDGLGGKNFGFNLKEIGNVSIPRLAAGAYVKPNTPQLAMIGDNRHQGELVAPEDKIYEISTKAMLDVMKQYMAQMMAMPGNRQGGEITVVLKVTGELAPLVRLLKLELDKEKSRTGVNFEVVYT